MVQSVFGSEKQLPGLMIPASLCFCHEVVIDVARPRANRPAIVFVSTGCSAIFISRCAVRSLKGNASSDRIMEMKVPWSRAFLAARSSFSV
jgi:hypothetical protein